MKYPDLSDARAHNDPATMLKAVEDAIPVAMHAAKEAEAGRFPAGSPGLLAQMWSIVDQLIGYRHQLISGTTRPIPAHRLSETIRWIFNDSWDYESAYGNYISGVMFLYEHKLIADGATPRTDNAAVEAIVREREAMLAKEKAKDAAEALAAPDPAARPVPHHPAPSALHSCREAARGIVHRDEPFLDRLDAHKAWSLSQQFLIRAYTGYWLQQPTPAVLKDLRRGCRIGWTAIGKGYPAHIWDLQQLFVDSVACRADDIAEKVIARKEAEWNLARVRPVPWLTARLRCLFALHRGEDARLPVLIEDFRRAAFVDVLPPELEAEKPLIFNSHHLVRALHERDQPQVDRLLAERMELLAKHYWRNIAPVALADTMGLAVVRWARERGLVVAVRHVYLPLDWLDLPPDAAASGGAG